MPGPADPHGRPTPGDNQLSAGRSLATAAMTGVAFGSAVRSQIICEREGPCPHCATTTQFRTVERRRWLYLCLVPVLRRDVVAVINECTTCNRAVELY